MHLDPGLSGTLGPDPRRAARLQLSFFLLALAAVYATALYIGSRLATFDAPQVMASAVVADLVLLVPTLFYFLVVRPRRWPWTTVVPAFILSYLVAGRIVPDAYHGALEGLHLLLAPLELVVLGYVAFKATQAVRGIRSRLAAQKARGTVAADTFEADTFEADTFEALRNAARDSFGGSRLSEVFAFELAVLYYSLFLWTPAARQRLAEASAPGRFSYHRDNAYGAVLVGLFLAMAAEVPALHLLVEHFWRPEPAWILTALGLYGIVWLLGDFQAARHRPLEIADDALLLRVGLRWNARIPFENIASLRRLTFRDHEKKPADTLDATLFGNPTFALELNEEIEVLGLYGLRRRTRKIRFHADSPADFEARLRATLDGRSPSV